jgi:hypothetical protein
MGYLMLFMPCTHTETPQPPAAEECPAQIIAGVLAKVLDTVPRCLAAGLRGWTYVQVTAVFLASQEAEITVLKLMSASRVLHVPALVQSNLLSISKPGGGTWPIAIGEVWYSLDGLCAFAPCKDVGQSLAPLQLGVVVPGGAQPICHALTAGITAKQSCLTLQLDLWNAFNTLSCQQML